MDKLKNLALPISLLTVALSISYYFVIFLPHKQTRELDLKQLTIEAEKEKAIFEQQVSSDKEKAEKASLDNCLQSAHENYTNNWNLNCPKYGGDKQSDGCTLPEYLSTQLDEDYKADQSMCATLYK